MYAVYNNKRKIFKSKGLNSNCWKAGISSTQYANNDMAYCSSIYDIVFYQHLQHKWPCILYFMTQYPWQLFAHNDVYKRNTKRRKTVKSRSIK